MAWFTHTVGSWQEFAGIADAHMLVGPPLLSYFNFRGQSDANWSLKPALTRLADEVIGETLVIEKLALAEFRTQCDAHFPPQLLGSEDRLTWLAAMQHYRAPTRLLDWSASPYVALYFAVSDESRWDRDGAVMCFHPISLVNAMTLLHPEYTHLGPPGEDIITLPTEWLVDEASPPCLYSCRSRYNTDRMLAQQGHFTVCLRPDEDHAEIIDRALFRQGAAGYNKLVIPAKLKPEFLHRMRAMNIAANSLFPGVDGVGRSISELVTMSRYKESYVPPTPADFKAAAHADHGDRRRSDRWEQSPDLECYRYTPRRGRVIDSIS